MPTKYHLYYDMMDSDRFIFNYTFMHDYEDIVTENYTLKVILPEGATDIKVNLFFLIEIDSCSF